MQNRFPEASMGVIPCFQVFAMCDLSIHDSVLQSCGAERLNILINHYGESVVDPEANTHEYEMVKRLVLDHQYVRDDYSAMWQVITVNHDEKLPNLKQGIPRTTTPSAPRSVNK